MPKTNPYLIPKLPETATVSYFNEAEWNKDLTPEEIVKRDEIAELEYQDWLLHGSQYGPCSYNGRCLDTCGNWDCDYYSRIVGSRAGRVAGFAVGGVIGGLFWNSKMNKTVDGIENELKSKWESEQAEEKRVKKLKLEEDERAKEKIRKINSSQSELDEKKRELERVNEEIDMCKSDSEYTRKKAEAERLENQIRQLKSDLCREKSCSCGGGCL